MGAWGAGPFDNDDAADFLGDLRESDDIELELARCLRMATGAYVEAPEGSCAIAAAAIIALTCSDAVDHRVREWSDVVADIAIKQTQAPALARLASAAIMRVTAADSELAALWEDGDATEWRAIASGVESSLRGVGTQNYQDWAPYPGLAEAAAIALRDPDAALDELRAVVNLADVRVFTLDREPGENPERLWQQVALIEGRRLILWQGEDETGRFDSVEFTSTIHVIPLSAVTEYKLRTTYQRVGGVRSLLSVDFWLFTATSAKSRAVSISETKYEVAEFYFGKSIVDGGLAQMERLLQFGRAVAQHA
ncbi:MULTISPECIES: DUF4259 domain-containing protein [unclassified Mycobacteroides]|uniref:DUF4259 domain-containing protein n=1 Tax=unclassified Mycobacteroides TaxID=2618759 RepID=UPI001396C66A|nr:MULTISPECIES: DUF4259 domain-containing protein [unclassified Mycobacteroides]